MAYQITLMVKPEPKKGITVFAFGIPGWLTGDVIAGVIAKAGCEGRLPGIKRGAMTPLAITFSSVTEKAEETQKIVLKVLKEDPLTSRFSITVKR